MATRASNGTGSNRVGRPRNGRWKTIPLPTSRTTSCCHPGTAEKLNKKVASYVRDFIPPIVFRIYRMAAGQALFIGNYATWEKARKESGGYDSDRILNKVRSSLLMVKNKEAVYERDSVLFDKVQYSWPLLACLLWIASQKGNRLNLVDFGGSLGSSYYQNRNFLFHLKELKIGTSWSKKNSWIAGSVILKSII